MNTISNTIYELTPDTHPSLWAALALGEHAPERLWLRGDIDALNRPTIAFAGARAGSEYAQEVTSWLARDLARTHTIVTSAGQGIDATAARVAADLAEPSIAVVAAGLDRFYPRGNRPIFDRILAAGGAILSDVEPGEALTEDRFDRRQRLIAALSRAAVFIEAGERSDSLTIAAWSRQLGRPIGAVPGLLTSTAHTGSHKLIREGATLITTADDIRNMLS